MLIISAVFDGFFFFLIILFFFIVFQIVGVILRLMIVGRNAPPNLVTVILHRSMLMHSIVVVMATNAMPTFRHLI